MDVSAFNQIITVLARHGLLFLCVSVVLWAPGFSYEGKHGNLASAQRLHGFAPSEYPADINYGQGVYFAPKTLRLYSSPSFSAPLIDTLTWNKGTNTSVWSTQQQRPFTARGTFLAFYPELELGLLPVLQDNGEDWVEVIYDAATQQSAWVPLRPALEEKNLLNEEPRHAGHFQTWLEFMKLNAKANGIYWLNGVEGYHRAVRMKPDDKALLVEVQIIKSMRVMHVRGNWLLVEVTDFDKQRPMGWVRWRDDNGQLMVFTNFAGKRQWVLPGS